MGGTRNIYTATNINTGEVIEGSSAEIGDMIGANPQLIPQSAGKGIKVKNEWIIDTIGQIVTENTAINPETCRKWDDFTGPIREYLRRKGR